MGISIIEVVISSDVNNSIKHLLPDVLTTTGGCGEDMVVKTVTAWHSLSYNHHMLLVAGIHPCFESDNSRKHRIVLMFFRVHAHLVSELQW